MGEDAAEKIQLLEEAAVDDDEFRAQAWNFHETDGHQIDVQAQKDVVGTWEMVDGDWWECRQEVEDILGCRDLTFESC